MYNAEIKKPINYRNLKPSFMRINLSNERFILYERINLSNERITLIINNFLNCQKSFKKYNFLAHKMNKQVCRFVVVLI